MSEWHVLEKTGQCSVNAARRTRYGVVIQHGSVAIQYGETVTDDGGFQPYTRPGIELSVRETAELARFAGAVADHATGKAAVAELMAAGQAALTELLVMTNPNARTFEVFDRLDAAVARMEEINDE